MVSSLNISIDDDDTRVDETLPATLNSNINSSHTSSLFSTTSSTQHYHDDEMISLALDDDGQQQQHDYSRPLSYWKIQVLHFLDKVEYGIEKIQNSPILLHVKAKIRPYITSSSTYAFNVSDKKQSYINDKNKNNHHHHYSLVPFFKLIYPTSASPSHLSKLFSYLLISLVFLYLCDSFYQHIFIIYPYSHAKYQSFNLFTNITNKTWKKMKHRVLNTPHSKFASSTSTTITTNTISNNNDNNNHKYILDPNVWYHLNWNVDFTCPNEIKVGGWFGDGPKWVCNPLDIIHVVNDNDDVHESKHRLNYSKSHHHYNNHNDNSSVETVLNDQTQYQNHAGKKYHGNKCLIYSIGVNAEGLDFEHSIQTLLTQASSTHGGTNHDMSLNHHSIKQHQEPFCEIHIFDPAGWHETLDFQNGVYYHNWGIRKEDGIDTPPLSSTSIPSDTNKMVGHFKTFGETVYELGHDGLIVDVMKVDCKMCEWDIYQDWFTKTDDSSHHNHHQQHDSLDSLQKNPRGSLHRIHQILVEVHGTPELHVNSFFDKMREENYVIFHKEANTESFGGMTVDYGFLKLRPEFFKD